MISLSAWCFNKSDDVKQESIRGAMMDLVKWGKI